MYQLMQEDEAMAVLGKKQVLCRVVIIKRVFVEKTLRE